MAFSNNSKKIALLVPTLKGGGAERVMVNLARAFSKHGLDIDFVVREKGPFLADISSNVRLIDLGARRMLTSLPAMVRYLRQEKPQVLLSAMSHANIIAIWAASIARVQTRVVVSVHNTISRNLDLSSLDGKIQMVLTKSFYSRANKIIVVSEAAKNDFQLNTNIDPAKLEVIYNPVVTPELFKKAKKPVSHPWFVSNELPVIIGVGRLTEQKDFSTLIRAFAIARQKQPARLLILGEGDERSKLQNLAIELGVEKDVDLHGFVINPYAFLSRAAVFVLSSEWEGLPTVLIESLAIGIQIISTDCPSGPREILNDGEYGALVPVGDEKAIGKCIIQYLQQPNMRRIPNEAWQRFELDRVSKKYLEVLTSDHITYNQ